MSDGPHANRSAGKAGTRANTVGRSSGLSGAVAEAAGPDAPMRMRWPEEKPEKTKADWRDTFSTATDLALIGFCVTAVALPIVTLGGAIGAGSFAVRHRYQTGFFPRRADVFAVFRRSLLPGLAGSVVVAVVTYLMLINITAIVAGAVPGGQAALVATVVVAVWLLGVVALTLVRLGRDPAATWLASARWAGALAPRAPLRTLAPGAVAGFSVVLGLMLPATTPLLVGCYLFAAHVVTDRLFSAEV